MADRIYKRSDGDKYPGETSRFVEFRYDGDRTISGTAIEYGDTATFPWGMKERFQAGAFPGIADDPNVVLTMQHQRHKPIARTGGGGMVLSDNIRELRLEATLPEGLTDADNALILVRERILRGFSIEFVPEEWRELKADNTVIIESAKLPRISLVDVAQYRKSTVDRRAEMDEDRIRELVEELLNKREESDGKIDAGALASGIAEGIAGTVETQIREQVTTALGERDAAEAARKTAEQETAAAEQRAVEERAKSENDAHERADLIVQLRSLITDGVELRGKTNHEIMVLAAGDEIENAEKRSEDYLLAKLEGILERREAATGGAAGGKPAPLADNPTMRRGRVSIHRIVEQKRAKARGGN